MQLQLTSMTRVGNDIHLFPFIKSSIYSMDAIQGAQMYKFITYKEWEDFHKESHPHARANQEKTEVVLTINNYSKISKSQCVDHEEAFKRVSAWAVSEEGWVA